MGDPAPQESSPDDTETASDYDSLRQELVKRSHRAERKARWNLVAIFVILILGIVAVILSPYISSFDREILQSDSTRELIRSKTARIERIDQELARLHDQLSIISKLPLYGIALSDDGRSGIAVGEGGTALFTNDGGVSWTPGDSGVGFRLNDVAISHDGQTGVAVGWDGVILTTEDGGSTWSTANSSSNETLEGVTLGPDGSGLAVGRSGTVLTTSDFGANWITNLISLEIAEDLYGVALSRDASFGFVVGDFGTVLKANKTPNGAFGTFDLGGFAMIEPDGSQSLHLYGVAINTDPESAIAVGWEGPSTVLKLSDGGRWERWRGDTRGVGSIEGVALDSSGNGIAVGFGPAVLTTSNGGETWISRNTNSTRLQIEKQIVWDVAVSADGEIGIAVGETGTHEPYGNSDGIVLVTNNGGSSWTNFTVELEGAIDKLVVDKEMLLRDIRNLEPGTSGRTTEQLRDENSEPSADGLLILKTGPYRLAVLGLVFFLLQVMLSLNRYNTRIAAFYLGRADALLLLRVRGEPIPLDAVDGITRMISPDNLDFGKTPKAITRHAVDFAREQSGRREK